MKILLKGLMMIQDINTSIKEKVYLNEDTVKLIFDYTLPFKPGQFLLLKLDKFFLRRPFVIIETNKLISIIFKIKGEGTEYLSSLNVGDKIDILLPLGNSFEPMLHKDLILIAGGTGVASLIPIVDTYKNTYNINAFIGFKDKSKSFYEAYFKTNTRANFAYNDSETSCFRGTVCDLLKNNLKNYCKDTPIFACGPTAMLKTLISLLSDFNNVYFSLEEKMACGVGACLGCAVKTEDTYKRVCYDGPIFNAKELKL